MSHRCLALLMACTSPVGRLTTQISRRAFLDRVSGLLWNFTQAVACPHTRLHLLFISELETLDAQSVSPGHAPRLGSRLAPRHAPWQQLWLAVPSCCLVPQGR